MFSKLRNLKNTIARNARNAARRVDATLHKTLGHINPDALFATARQGALHVWNYYPFIGGPLSASYAYWRTGRKLKNINLPKKWKQLLTAGLAGFKIPGIYKRGRKGVSWVFLGSTAAQDLLSQPQWRWLRRYFGPKQPILHPSKLVPYMAGASLGLAGYLALKSKLNNGG